MHEVMYLTCCMLEACEAGKLIGGVAGVAELLQHTTRSLSVADNIDNAASGLGVSVRLESKNRKQGLVNVLREKYEASA